MQPDPPGITCEPADHPSLHTHASPLLVRELTAIFSGERAGIGRVGQRILALPIAM